MSAEGYTDLYHFVTAADQPLPVLSDIAGDYCQCVQPAAGLVVLLVHSITDIVVGPELKILRAECCTSWLSLAGLSPSATLALREAAMCLEVQPYLLQDANAALLVEYPDSLACVQL